MPSLFVSWHRIAGQAILPRNAILHRWSHCLLLAFKTPRIRGITIPYIYWVQKGRIACLSLVAGHVTAVTCILTIP
jgi:hypothetical protein